MMLRSNNFLVGMFWGTTISIPLWISFLGWMKLGMRVLRFIFG